MVEALLFDNIFFSIAKGMLKKKLNILKGDYVFKKERNMGRQSKHLYINLPVNHVKESIAFLSSWVLNLSSSSRMIRRPVWSLMTRSPSCCCHSGIFSPFQRNN